MKFLEIRFCNNHSISKKSTFIRTDRVLEFREISEQEQKDHRFAKSRIVYESIEIDKVIIAYINLSVGEIRKQCES